MGKKLLMLGMSSIVLIVFLAFGISGIKDKIRYNKCDSETVGTLDRVQQYTTTEGKKKKHTVTRYKGTYVIEVGGNEYKVGTVLSGYRSEGNVPKTVDVVYMEEDPSECFIKGHNGSSKIFIAVISIPFFLIWFAILIKVPASSIKVTVTTPNGRRVY